MVKKSREGKGAVDLSRGVTGTQHKLRETNLRDAVSLGARPALPYVVALCHIAAPPNFNSPEKNPSSKEEI